MQCLYGNHSIDVRSDEHVLPYALGGSLSSYDICCRDCNSRLGREVDNYLGGYEPFEYVRNFFEIEGHGGNIPRVFQVDKNTGEKLSASRKLRFQRHIVKATETGRAEQPDGKTHIHGKITARDEGGAKKKAQEFLRAQERKLRRAGRESQLGHHEQVIVRSFNRDHELESINGELDHIAWFRAISKIAMNLFCYSFSRYELFAPGFHQVRAFIGGFGPALGNGYIDYRDRYATKPCDLDFFHRITIYCNPVEKNVVAYVELFEHIKASLVLNIFYRGKRKGISLIQDPITRTSQIESLDDFSNYSTASITNRSEPEEKQEAEAFGERVQMILDDLKPYRDRDLINENLEGFFSETGVTLSQNLNDVIRGFLNYFERHMHKDSWLPVLNEQFDHLVHTFQEEAVRQDVQLDSTVLEEGLKCGIAALK